MADGPTFDPSLLERKDRAELVTIVESLGGKVPARAKKADIVGQILTLVGHDEADGDGDEPDEDEAAVEGHDDADETDHDPDDAAFLRAAAEDVTSEVFQQALAHLSRFEWRGVPFVAWLFRSASNALAGTSP